MEVYEMIPRNTLRRYLILVYLSPLFFSFNLEASDQVVIKAKKIYAVSKGTVGEGMILIEDGKIARVGKGFDGDPLEDISRVTKVFIDGRMVADDE